VEVLATQEMFGCDSTKTYHIEPVAFLEKSESECVHFVDGKPSPTPYLDDLIALFNDGIFDDDKVEGIIEILCRPHDYFDQFSPPIAISRIVDKSWYQRTDPDGTCGYKACLQALRRSTYRRSAESTRFDADFDREIDLANVNLSTCDGMKEFREFISGMELSLSEALSSMDSTKSKAIALKSFIDEEMKTLDNWLDNYSLLANANKRNSVLLPRSSWFDAQFVPLVFDRTLDVNMMIFYINDNDDDSDTVYARATMISNCDFLDFYGYIDYPSYVKSVVSLNFFAYDKSHFYAQPTPKCRTLELHSLDSAIRDLSRRIVERLKHYYRSQHILPRPLKNVNEQKDALQQRIAIIDDDYKAGNDSEGHNGTSEGADDDDDGDGDDDNNNDDDDDDDDDIEADSSKSLEYSPSNHSISNDENIEANVTGPKNLKAEPTNDLYPSEIRAYIISDGMSDKRLPLAIVTEDKKAALYGMWPMGENFRVFSGLVLKNDTALSPLFEVVVGKTLFTIDSVEYVFCFAGGNRFMRLEDTSNVIMVLICASALVSFFEEENDEPNAEKAGRFIEKLCSGSQRVAMATPRSTNLTRHQTCFEEWLSLNLPVSTVTRVQRLRTFVIMCASGYASRISNDK